MTLEMLRPSSVSLKGEFICQRRPWGYCSKPPRPTIYLAGEQEPTPRQGLLLRLLFWGPGAKLLQTPRVLPASESGLAADG